MLNRRSFLALLALPLASAFASEPRSRRVLMFSSASCGPCRTAKIELNEWMTPSGWTIGEETSAHLQLIDVDREPDIASKFSVEKMPTFVLIENGKEIIRKVGYDMYQPTATRRKVVVELFAHQEAKQPASVRLASTPWGESGLAHTSINHLVTWHGIAYAAVAKLSGHQRDLAHGAAHGER